MPRAFDPDLEDPPDGTDPATPDPAQDDEDDLELDLDDEDGDDQEEDPKGASTKKDAKPTVASLTAELEAAKKKAAQATAAAQRAAAAVARERKARKAGGVNRNGKQVTPTGAEKKGAGTATTAADPEDRSAWPEAARLAVERSEREAAEAQAKVDAATAARVTTAIEQGLLAAGLKIPKDADAETRRKIIKRATRLMDTESIAPDDDGDIVGIEDEVEQVKLILPDLFGDPPASPSPTTLNDPPKPKPKVNLNGGAGAGTQPRPPKAPATTAEFLLSAEYKNRRAGKQVQ